MIEVQQTCLPSPLGEPKAKGATERTAQRAGGRFGQKGQAQVAVQEPWAGRDVPPALSVGSVPKEPCGSSRLCSGCSAHSCSPSLHPPPLCSHSASLPRPSLGLWWQQMVCCVQPGTEPRSPRSDGDTKPKTAVPEPRPFPGRGCRGHCAAHKSLVCAPGWGGEEFGFSLSSCIPLKRQPSVFTRPAEGSGFRDAGAAAWHKEGFQGGCAALTVGRAFLPCQTLLPMPNPCQTLLPTSGAS